MKTEKNEVILFRSKCQRGANIYRDGSRVYRVPPCTWETDDSEMVIVGTEGEANVMVRRNYAYGDHGEWYLHKSLGPAEGLVIKEDHHDSCGCSDCSDCGN